MIFRSTFLTDLSSHFQMLPYRIHPQTTVATLLLPSCCRSRPACATSTIFELLHPLLEELWIKTTFVIILLVTVGFDSSFIHYIKGCLCRRIFVGGRDGWHMTFKEREMAEELVLAGEGGAAGAAPLCLLAAVAKVAAEIGKNSETFLATAALASIELGAVAAAEVVARTHR